MIRSLFLWLALATTACATVVPDGAITGTWGGNQVELTVAADGSGRIELSCATAEFDGPVRPGVGGHFLVEGRFTRGTGVAINPPPPSIPATISGRLDRGGLLWLDIATRDSYPLRSAKLRRGAQAQLLRCL